MNKSIVYLYFIAFSAAIGGFLFGFDTAVVSGTISFVTDKFQLNLIQEGWFVSSALVGCILGALFAGEIADRLGRKLTLTGTGILFLISAIGCALVETFTGLVVYRIIG